jgi:dihydrofolate reductase
LRKIRHIAAMSLDGYIAGPNGETDWIIMDPAMDFAALMAQFDTVLVGRRTFQSMLEIGDEAMPGMKMFVFSRTFDAADYPEVTIVSSDHAKILKELRSQPGKDIWLFGGGKLFSALLDEGFVDTVEVAVVPVLLGGGVPLLPKSAARKKLKLAEQKAYPSGIVLLGYAVS